jgi:hypothetical protein
MFVFDLFEVRIWIEKEHLRQLVLAKVVRQILHRIHA